MLTGHCLVALALLSPLAACSDRSPAPAAPTTNSVPVQATPETPTPPGDDVPPLEAFTLAERAYAFTLFIDAPTTLSTVKAGLALPEGWTTLERLPADPPRPAVLVEIQSGEQVSPPSAEILKAHGRGLSEAQQNATHAATHAVVVSWLTGPDPQGKAFEQSQHSMLTLAEALKAPALWDETTREAFSVESWQGLRLGDQHPGLEGRRFVTVRMVADPTKDAPGHLVTSGMIRFGLPDVVLVDVSPAQARDLAPVLDLVSQALIEGQRPTPQGDLHLKAIAHPGVRARLGAGRTPPASAPPVALRITPKSPGDPENRLLKIDVPHQAGTDLHADRLRWLAAALGEPK
ncbi:MAG: hypothetical protein ACE366_15300 [Bradymonadia bacterium]